MKLLLAEDNPVARSAMAALATQWQYEVVAVNDGAAAWQALQEPDGPRLALLDWMMPVMDGLEVCRRARLHFRQNPPYLILLTGRDTEADLVAGLGGGADEYVVKPASPAELQARLYAGQRIVELQASLAERVRELEEALARVKQLGGLLPICSYCKKIRDDSNYWRQVEEYISDHSETQFSHGICPDCFENIVQPELRELNEADSPALTPPTNPPSTTLTPDPVDTVKEPPDCSEKKPSTAKIVDAPTLLGNDFRMRPRYQCNCEASFRLMSELGRAKVRDLSAGGVRLEMTRPVEPGKPLAIELFNKAGNYWHIKQLRVVHTKPAGVDHWVVGTAFLEELSQDQLQQMLH